NTSSPHAVEGASCCTNVPPASRRHTVGAGTLTASVETGWYSGGMHAHRLGEVTCSLRVGAVRWVCGGRSVCGNGPERAPGSGQEHGRVVGHLVAVGVRHSRGEKPLARSGWDVLRRESERTGVVLSGSLLQRPGRPSLHDSGRKTHPVSDRE